MQMSTVVNPTNVLIGPEFVPRKPAGPGVLLITSGQVYTPGPAETWDYVEIQSGGTLLASRTVNTVLKVTTLIVLPGGTLDLGTEASPQTGHFELVFRDVPIDTMMDPFQWGNGLINFGSRYQVAPAKDPWGLATGDLPAGTTTITLAAVPNNWEVGDALLIPDMQCPQLLAPIGNPYDTLPVQRRETPVTIQDINGATITLSKPLDFEHLCIRTPAIAPGSLTPEEIAFLTAQGIGLTGNDTVLVPRVFNLTRKHLCTSSENPAGTRGHQVDVGAGAFWDIEYNCTEALGRTTTGVIDITVFPSPFTGTPTHLGTNQIARYNDHRHHCASSPTCKTVGNVWTGLGGIPGATKWGISIHQTSDSLIQHNIAVDFPGAGIVTEDGNEVRNVFDHNAALYCFAADHAERTRIHVSDARFDILAGQPGTGGDGFWFHGVQNTITRNESWCNYSSGLNLINQNNPAGILYPSVVGGMPDTPLLEDPPGMLPILFTDNVTACNSLHGLELWSTRMFPITNHIGAFNTFSQVQTFAGNGTAEHHVNCTYLGNCDGPLQVYWQQVGVVSGDGYIQHFQVDGGQIRGCSIGISGGGSLSGMFVTKTLLQNLLDVERVPAFEHTVFDTVLSIPIAGHPHQYIYFYPTTWDGNLADVPDGMSNIVWWDNHGTNMSIEVHNWQGTGKDYRLYYNQQLRNTLAFPSREGVDWACPDVNLTTGQCWDTYGNAWLGDVLDPAEDVALQGLVNGHARLGLLPSPPQPPRAIVTFPTLRDPATVTPQGYIIIRALATGDPTMASPILMGSVDGGVPVSVGVRSPDDIRDFASYQITPGAHTVSVWRTTIADPTVEIPGSRMTAQYVVGTAVTPPPPPPPPQMVVVPNLVGLSQAAATTALTSAGLTLGTVTVVETVVSQSPAATASVTPGSAVNLIVH